MRSEEDKDQARTVGKKIRKKTVKGNRETK